MKKVTYALIIITSILFVGLGFLQRPLLANTETEIESGEEILLNITTVSKNQYYMIKSIVLNKHNIEYLSNNEKEINEFKYNDDVINNISKRDLFIYSGANNEPWVNEFIGKLKRGDLGIINMSRGIKTLTYENESGKENPYYWLGINEYKIALYNIKSAIQEKDPKNKDYYEENYNNAIKNIEVYEKEIKIELDKYKGYTILTNSNTFDYLLKGLGLDVVKIQGEVTKKIIVEKNLDENKIILVKEKNPIEIMTKLEEKKVAEVEVNIEKDIDKNEDKAKERKKLQDEEIELAKPVDVRSIELTRWDGEQSLIELTSSNIKLVIEELKSASNKNINVQKK